MQNNLIPSDVMVPASSPMMPANVTYYATLEEQGLHLRDYWHVLAKRKWWFFGVLFFVVGITLAITLLMDPIYKVHTTLQIIQDNPSAIVGGGGTDPLGTLTGSTELDRFYETQYNILQSPAIAYSLIDSLNLKEHPSYKKMENEYKDSTPEAVRQKYAEYLLSNLKVEPVKNSYLVSISFTSTDKNLAHQVPQAIQGEYLKLSMQTRQQSYAMLREWLDGELNRLGKKLEVSEQNVYSSGQANDFLSLEDTSTNVTVQKYIDVSKLLTTAQSEKTIKEAQYRQIQERGMDAPLITNNTLISQLRQQLIDLESQVSGNRRIYGSNYPEYQAQSSRLKELRDRLNQEIKRMATSIQSDYEAASRAESLLQKEFDLQKSKVIDMQNKLVKHHILKRDLQTNQTLYEGLLARMKEASVASSMVSSNVSVIDAPEVPHKPWMPKPLLFLSLGVAVGCLAGLMTAFFVEYLDNSIKSTEELEKTCHIPVLGMVPMADIKEIGSEPNSLELVTYSQPMSMVSEAVFHIRTALMLSSSAAPPQVIAITSPNPGEGKTTISSNLAISLAGSDQKCLIIDCDLRKPRLHKVFHQQNKIGLTNFLTGNASLEDVIRPTAVPNLYFIPAGPTPPNPNELFSSGAFKNLLNVLRKGFQHIVIDSPPSIGFADARTISANADGIVLVFKHHSTTRDAAQLSVRLLSQNNCRILGSILTMALKDRMGYGGYYDYYHNYNKYYKGYREGAEGNGDEEPRLLK